MKAAVIREIGPPSVLSYEDAPDPALGASDVLIRVEAISLEGGDLLYRRIWPPRRFPHIVGYQAAGTVAAVGPDVRGFRVGDRVVGFAPAGSHAELFRVEERHALAIPDALAIDLAATLPIAFGTADEALFEFGRLQPGETVLIQGGAGGVGLAAIQLAHQAGATVLATARGAERAQKLCDYGCDYPIAYDATDVAEETLRLTSGKGADLVLDMAGGAAIKTLIRAAAQRARIAVIGASSGETPSFGFSDILPKQLSVIGILFGRDIGTPRATTMLTRHFDAVADGRLRMPIAKTFTLADAAAAHAYAEQQHPFGRVIIKP